MLTELFQYLLAFYRFHATDNNAGGSLVVLYPIELMLREVAVCIAGVEGGGGFK